jgi:hypothetical protein
MPAQKPKVRDIDQFGTAWTGRAPTSVCHTLTEHTKPARLLCTSLGGKDGMYSDRVKGNNTIFKPNDSGITLQKFTYDVNLKLINHSMDSIF